MGEKVLLFVKIKKKLCNLYKNRGAITVKMIKLQKMQKNY